MSLLQIGQQRLDKYVKHIVGGGWECPKDDRSNPRLMDLNVRDSVCRWFTTCWNDIAEDLPAFEIDPRIQKPAAAEVTVGIAAHLEDWLHGPTHEDGPKSVVRWLPHQSFESFYDMYPLSYFVNLISSHGMYARTF